MSTAPASSASAQLTCPECHTRITYYDVAGSEYYVCPKCHSYFQYADDGPPRVIGTYQQAPGESPVIPLGQLGTLAGQPWRVVAVVRRYQYRAAQYAWHEYQLLHTKTGKAAQLTEYNGHWMLVQRSSHEYGAKSGGKFAFDHQDAYQLYNRYQARILWALGEFDWDIESDNHNHIAEYIRPPLMLVREQHGRQRTWYRAEHVEPAAVAGAFGLTALALPWQLGVGAVQPDLRHSTWPAVRGLALLAMSLIVGLQVLLLNLYPSQQVLQQPLRVMADPGAAPGTGRVMVSPSFTLAHAAPLEIGLVAALSNQWLELSVNLVNEQTGRSFEFTKNIEFYQGVESGESWSEGSRQAEALLSAVPAGRYHLNFYPFSEAGPATPDLTVTVTTNPVLWSNFSVALLLVLAYPAWCYWRHASFETRRWSESAFGPK